MLAIRLPENIETRLGLLAEKTGRTKTYYAKEAILRFIEELEDKYMALSRLEKPANKILSENEHFLASVKRNEELLKLLA